MYSPTPALAVISIAPDASPKQSIWVIFPSTWIESGSMISTEIISIQLFASITVAVYIPARRSKMSSSPDVYESGPDQFTMNPPAPPERSNRIEPVVSP